MSKGQKKNIESINWKNEFPNIPTCVHDAIEIATSEIMEKEHKSISYMRKAPIRKMIIVAAVITLLSGMTVMAATGLWQQRMEAMNREEIEQYFISIATSGAPAFRYNRAMSETEQTNYDKLKDMYENEGVFPEGELTMLSTARDYKGKNIGYDKKSGTFFLPEEELSEEQLLQIIDFYHKVEYAVVNINQTTDEKEMAEIIKDEILSEEPAKIMVDYEPLNDAVSYYEITFQGQEPLSAIATGTEYLYLGFKTEIKRMTLKDDETETFYKLEENQTVYAMDSDSENNVYLSLREYYDENDTYINRLIKINAEGKIVQEYDLESAVYDQEKTLKEAYAYKMVADEKGQLYVKGGWSPKPVLFIFNTDGECVGKVETDDYTTHTANGISIDGDNNLYVLANEYILKFDESSKELSEAYPYWSDNMAAAVDIVYPMGENNFYFVSYDGLFKYTAGEESSKCLLAPYESEVFSEGYRCKPISRNELVIVNIADYEKNQYKMTYLQIK